MSKYRIFQTDADKFIPQTKVYAKLFGFIPLPFYTWKDVGVDHPSYEDALVRLKEIARRLEKILKIQANRRVDYYEVEKLIDKEELERPNR